MKKSMDKTARPGPVELDERALGDVAGGLEVKLQDCLISGYSMSSGGDRPTESIVPDPTLDPQLKH
jgi:hypothetical protein